MIGNSRSRGAKLVAIDPRQTAFARDADLWARVSPGTDAALALGLAHCLVRDETFDRNFVTRWTSAPFLVREDTGNFLRASDIGLEGEGFLVLNAARAAPLPAGNGDAALNGRYTLQTRDGPLVLRTAFYHYDEPLAPYAPEQVEGITGTPVRDIEALAAMIGGAKSVAYHGWTGVGQHTNATQTGPWRHFMR